MKPISRLLLVIFLSALIFACDRPDCTNVNPVFDQYLPGEKLYNDELASQLTRIDQDKLSYWFKEYRVVNQQEELCFYVQGDGLCAEIVMKVTDWTQLEDLRKAKGKTYSGAEFVKLRYEVLRDTLTTEFIFKRFARIID
ncbi:MAG: hypothetical protein IPH84_09560 [Bacteroidales bacterium]|nr:hypothetical protein [Bacteroidales bacterium]